jgi:hypothetical protein
MAAKLAAHNIAGAKKILRFDAVTLSGLLNQSIDAAGKPGTGSSDDVASASLKGGPVSALRLARSSANASDGGTGRCAVLFPCCPCGWPASASAALAGLRIEEIGLKTVARQSCQLTAGRGFVHDLDEQPQFFRCDDALPPRRRDG